MQVSNTKQLILQASIDLFAEKGYANVSIRDIAQRVGVKSASIYNHFASKDDIMGTIMDQYRMTALKTLATMDETGLEELLRGKSFPEVAAHLFAPFPPEEVDQIRKMCQILIREQFNHPKAKEFWSELMIAENVKSWKKTLDIMVADGRIPPINTLLASEFLTRIGVTYLLQFTHFQNGEETDNSLSMDTVNGYILERIRQGEI